MTLNIRKNSEVMLSGSSVNLLIELHDYYNYYIIVYTFVMIAIAPIYSIS